MTQSDIRVKSYCRLNLLRAFIFSFEPLDILRDSCRHPCKKLLSFDFSKSFPFQLQASWYITGHKRTPELNVILVCICKELPYSVSSVSIYYRTQSDIRLKSYYHLNFLKVSVFNFERLDILRDSIRHPSKKLLSFELAQSFNIQFRGSRYITSLNRKSE